MLLWSVLTTCLLTLLLTLGWRASSKAVPWSNLLKSNNKYRRCFIVGGPIKAGRGQEWRFSKEIQQRSLHGLGVTGKIIINNTENLLGAYYDLNVTRSCATKHSTKQSSHPKSVCLPLASSNRTNHSIKHIYWMYTAHDPTTIPIFNSAHRDKAAVVL